MQIDNLNLIYFSPTGTTQNIVSEISKGISCKTINEYNIGSKSHFENIPSINENSLSLIGVPVYSGRVPLEALERLKQFKAHKGHAVLFAVYGNRAFEDALVELRDVVAQNGFVTIAAAAFIGEHSYSSDDKPIGENRPDLLDLEKVRQFAVLIQQKVKSLNASVESDEVDLPGNYPYKERKVSPLLSPETNMDLCTLCGICEDVCPTNAIVVNQEVVCDKEKCIWCCACVKSCPSSARIFNNSLIQGIADNLYRNCQERKEPEFFL
jgi:ferredoxin/flavodoxin